MISPNSALAFQLRTFSGFPSPPTVALKLIELAKAADPNIKEVVKIVELDSVLTLKILRLANSARYLQRRKSSTVCRALVMMGVNAALTVGLSFSLLECLPESKSKGLDHKLFWRRSLLAAISARCIGEVLKSQNGDELFMTALLQDVGILALANADPKMYCETLNLESDHFKLGEHERERLGANHAEVTAYLLGSWNLPGRVISAIAESHQPSRVAARTETERFHAVIAMSGLFADLFIKPQSSVQCEKVARIAQQLLGVEKPVVGWILDRIRAVMPDTEEMFGMQLASDPEKLVAQALQLMQVIEAESAAFAEGRLLPSISERIETERRLRGPSPRG
jgi:HD-like signal output (HDOD) protein